MGRSADLISMSSVISISRCKRSTRPSCTALAAAAAEKEEEGKEEKEEEAAEEMVVVVVVARV